MPPSAACASTSKGRTPCSGCARNWPRWLAREQDALAAEKQRLSAQALSQAQALIVLEHGQPAQVAAVAPGHV